MKNTIETKIPKIEFLNAESGIDFHWWYKNETPIHSHTYYEIVVIQEGPVNQICNDVKYTMEKRDLFILKPGDVHRFFSSPYASQLNFSIVPKELKKLCNGIHPDLYNTIKTNAPKLIRLPEEEFNYCTYLSAQIGLSDNGKNTKNEIVIKQQIYNLLVAFSHFFNSSDDKNKFPDWLTAFINTISSPEYLEKKVQDLYSLAPYSQSLLNRYFKKYTGTTLVDYMKQLKMNYAEKLLIHSDYSISQIADKISYTSSYFIHEFTEKYKCSPAKYRNILNKTH